MQADVTFLCCKKRHPSSKTWVLLIPEKEFHPWKRCPCIVHFLFPCCHQNSCRGEEPVWVSCTAGLWALSCIMWLIYSVSNDPELVLWGQPCRSVWYSLKIAPRVRLLLKWVLWLPREQLKGAGAAEQCSAQLPAGKCDLCGTHVLAV